MNQTTRSLACLARHHVIEDGAFDSAMVSSSIATSKNIWGAKNHLVTEITHFEFVAFGSAPMPVHS
jgi:hypothetical protein